MLIRYVLPKEFFGGQARFEIWASEAIIQSNEGSKRWYITYSKQ